MEKLNHDIKSLLELLDSINDSEKKIANVIPLHSGGGARKYFRLVFESGESLIGVVADNVEDARAFISLSRIFRSYNVNVPLVYKYRSDYKYYLQQDLGNLSLYDLIVNQAKSVSSDIEHIITKVLEKLVLMQSIPEREWDKSVNYSPFSKRLIFWDLNYFKYEYLKPSGIEFDEDALEDDFERLSVNLLSIPYELWGFQMRDCQSRNIMISHDKTFFIDFQGGRKGPCLYDAISLLWQAKAHFTDDFRMRMLKKYADLYGRHNSISSDKILFFSGIYILFRTLQVLGAYGFRGLVQKRAHFIESIPGALSNLNGLISKGDVDAYPELKKICKKLIIDSRFTGRNDARLRVTVFSFSYKKGYPEDYSGNGGGFMFDCRGMHNPGRYSEYKNLTGRDMPVVQFLKETGEADIYADKAFDLVSSSIERYLKRGFTSLQIGFGCTGGQHRSVYCAERVAKKIANMYPEAIVILHHREQEIIEQYNSDIIK